LTGTRYMQLHRTLICASVTDQLDRGLHGGKASVTDTTAIINRNAAFLRANPKVEPGLREVGLEFLTLQGQ